MVAEAKKPGLDLAELLPVLRSEIDKAVENLNKSGKGALFDLKEAQVEVHFVVTKEVESGAKGGVPMVFAVELGGSYGTERVHKLSLTLVPKAGTPSVSVAEQSRTGD